MRLKVAGVLVDDDQEIWRFVDREREGKQRGTDIYAAHENLWAVRVYVHPDLKGDRGKCELLLASLAADLDMQLGDLGEHLGASPHEWPHRIAVRELGHQVDRVFEEYEVEELLARRLRQVSARGDVDERPALHELVSQYRELLD
jgi:hypothetical protein